MKRVDVIVPAPDGEVQMFAGHLSGCACYADRLPGQDRITRCDEDAAQVTVDGCDADVLQYDIDANDLAVTCFDYESVHNGEYGIVICA